MRRRKRLIVKSAGTTRGTTFTRTRRATGPLLVTIVNARSVVATSRFAKASRSGAYVASTRSLARPAITAASFHARFTESPIPVFIPCPPTGL